MQVACAPELHRHPPAYRCSGCRCPVGADDAVVTTTGRYWVCGGCWERWRRAGFGRKGAA